MGEKVIVRQNADFTAKVFASDPENEESIETHPVEMLFELSPYGMLMLSIGTCTTILLLSYAKNHKIDLQTVEIRLEYQRKFKEDCEHCEEIQEYTGQIRKEIRLAENSPKLSGSACWQFHINARSAAWLKTGL